MDVFEILAWVIILVQAFAIFVLVRELADLRKLAGNHGGTRILPVGAAAPVFEAIEYTSRQIIRADRWRGRSVVLLFVSPGCAICRKLITELAAASRIPPDLVVYGSGELAHYEDRLSLVAGKATVLTKASRDVPGLFGVSEFPVAVRLNEQWRVADITVPMSIEDLQDLRALAVVDPLENRDAA